MYKKYPGGYQIIDLKGLSVYSGGTIPITDPEVVEKILFATQMKKPVYLTGFVDRDEEGIPNPLLIEYDPNDGIFSYVKSSRTDGTWMWSLIIDASDESLVEISLNIAS